MTHVTGANNIDNHASTTHEQYAFPKKQPRRQRDEHIEEPSKSAHAPPSRPAIKAGIQGNHCAVFPGAVATTGAHWKMSKPRNEKGHLHALSTGDGPRESLTSVGTCRIRLPRSELMQSCL